jgi:hypothetical protein
MLQEEKAFSEDQSALVSTAYATLRHPLKRAIYLVRAADSAVWRMAGGFADGPARLCQSICGTVTLASSSCTAAITGCTTLRLQHRVQSTH